MVTLLNVGEVNLLLDLLEVDVGNGVLAIEDLGDLLEGGSLGLNVDEVDPDELDEVPELCIVLARMPAECQNLGGKESIPCRRGRSSSEQAGCARRAGWSGRREPGWPGR